MFEKVNAMGLNRAKAFGTVFKESCLSPRITREKSEVQGIKL